MTDVTHRSVVPVKTLEIETATETKKGEWNENMELLSLNPDLKDKAQIVNIDGGYALYFMNEDGNRRYIGVGDDEAKLIFSTFKKYGDVAKALRAMEKNFDLYETSTTTLYQDGKQEKKTTNVSLAAAEKRLVLMALANVYSNTRPDRQGRQTEGPWEVDTIEYRRTIAVATSKEFLKRAENLNKYLDKLFETLDTVSEIVTGREVKAKISTIDNVVALVEGNEKFKGYAGKLFELKALQEDFDKFKAEAQRIVDSNKEGTLAMYGVDYTKLVRGMRDTSARIDALKRDLGSDLQAMAFLAVMNTKSTNYKYAIVNMDKDQLLALKRTTQDLLRDVTDQKLRGELIKIEEEIAKAADKLRTFGPVIKR